MKAVYFPESNKVLRAPNCLDLHVYNDGHESISVWELEPEELEMISKTGKILLAVLAGESQPPVKMAVYPYSYKEIKMEDEAVENTDRELYREDLKNPVDPDNYYSPRVHVTAQGEIGMSVGGNVIVMSIQKWMQAAIRDTIAEHEKK